MVSTRRTKRVSNPIVPVANVEEKMDTSEAPKPQKNKSNRWWKKTQTAPSRGIVKVKPLHSKWKKKMQLKADLEQVKNKQAEIRDAIQAERQEKAERRKENEERRQRNIEKNEIVQIIKNTDKLRRMNKKQLRLIKKRDTEKLAKK